MTRKYKRKTKDRPTPRSVFKPGFDPRRKRGRDKGTPNRFTSELKTVVLNAFARAGGENYLVLAARKDRRSFLGLLSKLLPTKVTGEDGPIQLEMIQRAQGGLANLSDKELKSLEQLLSKVGVAAPTPEN